MDLKNRTIYKLNTPTGEVYIGQTVNLKGRLTYHKNAVNMHDSRLYSAMRNCGWDLVEKTVLFQGECTKALLDDLEVHYIRLYNSFDSVHGLNMNSGGTVNYKSSAELRKKLSEAIRPPQDPDANRRGALTRTGRKNSEEVKKKMSIAHTGKKMSPEACRKMSEYWTGRPSFKKGIPMSEKQKLGMKGINGKAVVSDVLNKEWPTSRAAALELGCGPTEIWRMMKGIKPNEFNLQFKA